MLDDLGLVPALEWHAREISKRTGLRVQVAAEESAGDLSDELKTCIYRVVQEALHNVAKHANATTVNIEMKRDGDLVRLTIDDDGVGITPKPTNGRQTFGMAGMRERIGNIGGKVKVSSARGQGTRIEVNAPVSGNGVAAGKEVTRGGAGVVAQGA